MKKKRFLCLVLVLGVLLSGCSLEVLAELVDGFQRGPVTPYSQMEYVRPDMDALEATLAESCAVLENTKVPDQAIEAIDAFYIVYDDFYTAYNLANIRYSGNLADIGWEAEYNFCAEKVSLVDAALDELYRVAAKAPTREMLEETWFGEGFFDAYDGESLWDDTFLALMEEESRLQNAYYELSDGALEYEYLSEEYFSEYGTKMLDLFVELVALRQRIAEYAGYDSYPQFAYDFYYYRDYTPEQAELYLEQIGKRFYDRFTGLDNAALRPAVWQYCSQEDTFNYVKKAAQAMGGTPAKAFSTLEEAGVYDIAYGENKFDSSFEAYLWSYSVPFIFMNPVLDQRDKLIFAHEFGHFANDYACFGSYAGTDVAEVHSQAFEYLSLCYGDAPEELKAYKLAESLQINMEQAALGLFEHRVYALEGEELTAENVQALYTEIGTRFGLDSWGWDPRDLVTVIHYYTYPMYIVSYVVSNDVALQIYELELAEAGQGLALYEKILESQDSFLIAFTETYGLKSPFAPKRLEEQEALFDRIR